MTAETQYLLDEALDELHICRTALNEIYPLLEELLSAPLVCLAGDSKTVDAIVRIGNHTKAVAAGKTETQERFSLQVPSRIVKALREKLKSRVDGKGQVPL